MISLSQAAGVPEEGVSPDALLSGSVCMFSALGPGRKAAGLRHVAGGRVVPDVSESWLSVIVALVVGVVSPGPSCGRKTDPADCACTAAGVGNAACAAPGSPGESCANVAAGVVATVTAVAPASQPWAPPAAYAGVCGGACGHSCLRCGAVVGLPLREGCTDSVVISVAVCGAAGGLCGLGVLLFVLSWEEAVEELDTSASALLACRLSAARRACSVGWRMVHICVRFVRGFLVCRWGLAVGDICRRCLLPGWFGLLSVSAQKVTHRAAEGGVRLSCWVPADLLDPCGGCGVRGECCPVSLSGAC